MRMIIPYQVSSKQRTKLADYIKKALDTITRYMMCPTCNYEIGEYILDRNEKLSI